jgi:hypothetical protein
MQGFWNEETAYQEWLASHPEGYVLNLHSPAKNRSTIHLVSCMHLYETDESRMRTESYGKVVANTQEELRHWASSFGHTVVRCGTCKVPAS